MLGRLTPKNKATAPMTGVFARHSPRSSTSAVAAAISGVSIQEIPAAPVSISATTSLASSKASSMVSSMASSMTSSMTSSMASPIPLSPTLRAQLREQTIVGSHVDADAQERVESLISSGIVSLQDGDYNNSIRLLCTALEGVSSHTTTDVRIRAMVTLGDAFMGVTNTMTARQATAYLESARDSWLAALAIASPSDQQLASDIHLRLTAVSSALSNTHDALAHSRKALHAAEQLAGASMTHAVALNNNDGFKAVDGGSHIPTAARVSAPLAAATAAVITSQAAAASVLIGTAPAAMLADRIHAVRECTNVMAAHYGRDHFLTRFIARAAHRMDDDYLKRGLPTAAIAGSPAPVHSVASTVTAPITMDPAVASATSHARAALSTCLGRTRANMETCYTATSGDAPVEKSTLRATQLASSAAARSLQSREALAEAVRGAREAMEAEYAVASSRNYEKRASHAAASASARGVMSTRAAEFARADLAARVAGVRSAAEYCFKDGDAASKKGLAAARECLAEVYTPSRFQRTVESRAEDIIDDSVDTRRKAALDDLRYTTEALYAASITRNESWKHSLRSRVSGLRTVLSDLTTAMVEATPSANARAAMSEARLATERLYARQTAPEHVRKSARDDCVAARDRAIVNARLAVRANMNFDSVVAGLEEYKARAALRSAAPAWMRDGARPLTEMGVSSSPGLAHGSVTAPSLPSEDMALVEELPVWYTDGSSPLESLGITSARTAGKDFSTSSKITNVLLQAVAATASAKSGAVAMATRAHHATASNPVVGPLEQLGFNPIEHK